ncbi:hypothetical protein OH733_20405 [Streptomyces griseus]|uniref:hypothetical protein n=1 Tax=Streptomyces griseus TaxID=1911 RepID=UPI00386C4784|nr:hypothetical protein OH733_20405 [Streptomyces griseus]WTD68420.1 hypothetical protein OH763_16580 [Streptomyces griseus]
MKAGKILHPFIWGRELYDRAFDLFSNDPSELDHGDSLRLLGGTSRGIFQELDLITGPLGILRSREMRSAPSAVRIPLYHCVKRSCSVVHGTFLSTADSQISKTQAKLEEVLEKEYGVASEFYEFFDEVEDSLCDFYGDRRCVGEIPLLGECFSDTELDSVLLEALKGKGAPLREALSCNGITVGDPREFSESLARAEKIQALLLMTSRDLVRCIDRAVYTRQIDIPEHEIRNPKIMRVSSGFYDLSAECSRYGVRVMPSDSSLALVRLQRLILAIYPASDPNASRDLSWRLKKVQGGSPEEKLNRYMAKEEPAEVIRNLVLVGPGPFSIAADKCGVTPDDVEDLEDVDLLNILLWKLGFDVIANNDEASGSLQRHRQVFAQAVAAFSGYSDSEKYEIKRESAPLFSSLEKTLDSTLSFSTWALTFDHWSAHPRFDYHLSGARAHMADLLNKAARASSSEPVIYDSQGRNTLFPLISGFSRLREYLERLCKEADSHKRPSSEMPSYARHAELTPFPFLHTVPFLDLNSDSQMQILNLLKDFTRILEEGGVTSVRNRLQHQREDFPREDELLRCVRAIGSFLDSAESSGLCPTFFKSTGTSRDSAGRSSFSLKDYRGREYIGRRPSGIGYAGMPGLLSDQFVIPVATLKASTDVLRFSVGARSTYTELWQDWPKYRTTTDSTRGLLKPLMASDVS